MNYLLSQKPLGYHHLCKNECCIYIFYYAFSLATDYNLLLKAKYNLWWMNARDLASIAIRRFLDYFHKYLSINDCMCLYPLVDSEPITVRSYSSINKWINWHQIFTQSFYMPSTFLIEMIPAQSCLQCKHTPWE